MTIFTMNSFPKTRAFIWKKNQLLLLDQRILPHKTVWITCRTWKAVSKGIRDMAVRGAPAIGCVAAYGIALAGLERKFKSLEDQRQYLDRAFDGLLQSRPTAVNLRWALGRMRLCYAASPTVGVGNDVDKMARALVQEAIRIEEEDRAGNSRIGKSGAALLPLDAVVLTHCNTGSLATAGLGTAFGVLWTAHRGNQIRKVIACETRPYLQGSRLTAWELQQEKIPFELITDSMAAHMMKTEKIDAVIVGADRIAANGDTANKIGTYSLAVLAHHHDIPFYVAAPLSTVDLSTATGKDIPIEERSAQEVVLVRGQSIAPKNTLARHPAFDVTPADLIAAIITDHGVAKPSYSVALRDLFERQPALI
jgi:methylthioribose-1-phosphate isomerase